MIMRRLIALLTAVLLLLCQTSALAQFCATAAGAESAAAAAPAPCHDDHSGSQPAAVSVCEASQALAENAKVPVFDFPAPVLVIALRDIARAPQTDIHAAVHAVCSSPPLTVLHCRFLN